MTRITPTLLEYNTWNGFTFELIGIETRNFEGALFGIYINSHGLQICAAFIRFEIKSPLI